MTTDTDIPIHILVVDDEPGMRSVLRQGLEEAGYAVSEAGRLSEVMRRIEQEPPISLITLDLMLGNEDGLLLARGIRAKRNVPIIMITALAAPVDRVTGLEHGADDYIVKPFDIREVQMRVQSVLRRYELEGDKKAADTTGDVGVERYEFEAGVLDVGRRELVASGGVMDLTDGEFNALVLFVRNPRRVLSRDDLAMKLQGRNWSPLDRTIDGHIARLRKKIEPVIDTPRFIKTVWGVGYVFAGDVRRLS